MNIIDYCNENKIKTLPINLILNEEGKYYPCVSKPIDGNNGKFADGRQNFIITDFKKFSFKQCQTYMGLYGNETEWVGIDTTVIQQMDIDDLTGNFWLPQTQEEIDNSEAPAGTNAGDEKITRYQLFWDEDLYQSNNTRGWKARKLDDSIVVWNGTAWE